MSLCLRSLSKKPFAVEEEEAAEEADGGGGGGGGRAATGERSNISMFAGDVCTAGDFVVDIVVNPAARPNFPKLVRSFL